MVGRDLGPGDVEPVTWAQAELGRAVTADAYLDAVESLRAWSRRVARWWDPDDGGFDLLLTPTMAKPPAPLGEIRGDDAEGAIFAATPYAAFTVPFNVTGQPAMSVPLSWADGLPIGVQLVAATGREDLLFRVAAQLEAARPWADRAALPSSPEYRRQGWTARLGSIWGGGPPSIHASRARVVATRRARGGG